MSELPSVDTATVAHPENHCELGEHPKEMSINVVNTDNCLTAGNTLSFARLSSLESTEHSFSSSAFLSFPCLAMTTFHPTYLYSTPTL